jgi:tetratricopeptide (TPR) repeat protein
LEQKDFAGAECSLCRLDDANSAKPDTPDDAYLLALSYQGQGRFEKALETLQPVLADGAGDLAANASLVEASLLTALRRYDEALQTLTSHCSQSDTGQALALSAICHARLGNREQAMQAYQEAAAFGPDTAQLRCDAAEQIAQASLDAEEFDRAETLYREILAQADDSQRKDRALVGLAWAQQGRKDFAAAETTLDKVVDHEADEAVLAEAWFLRGRVLQELGKSELACQAFRQVVDEYPGSDYEPEALWNVAQLQERLGRPNEAAACYQKILDRRAAAEHRAGALYNLAWIRLQEGQPEEADSHFREIVTAHRDSPYWTHASLSVAQHDLDAGRSDEAQRTLDEVLKDEQGQAVRDRALYLAGQIAFASAAWHEARQRFEQVASECPRSELVATSAFAAAEAAFQAKDGDTLALFESLAARSDGLNPALRATARMRLAQLYAEAGRWDEASEIAESFAERHPDFAQQYEIDYVLGRCRAARALFAEAREAYEKVLHAPAAERTETAAKAQLMIAETFFHQRRYGEAYRAYMQVEVFYAYPELQAAALLQAGKCRQLQGDPAAAGRLYQQVLDNYPGSRAALQAARQLERAT